MSTQTNCIHCGALLKTPGAKFCTSCGKPQTLVEARRPASDPALTPAQATPAAATVVALPAASGSAQSSSGHPTASITGAFLRIQDSGQTRDVVLGSSAQTLGRATDNDIVLVSRFVSSRHARIEPEGLAHRISDVGSTNGLLFEGQRVPAHSLADGDVLRIGDPATGNFVSLTYHNPAAQRAARSAQVQQNYPLNPADPQILVGREGAEIVLNNPQVSRRHATVDRLSDGRHVLRDLGSTNGTFVNGARVSQHVLNRGDVIQIGPFKLVYNGTSLDQYDQRGALRIDARGLWRQVSRGGKSRLILKDVSLSIAPREFVALVGGSGTGKSTLLNALAGYVRATSGQVLVNGDDYYANFDAYRTVLGYVPQDDIIHRELPVSRALNYAAQLRLPADTAATEINARITRVLEDVEMTIHRDKPVDALSGGQRKRVSIGAELLADPSLFFLDEPTSGLDPGLEKKMMYTLRRLADSGRTVLLVTHATANITQCDHVAFMSDGRMVYFGPPEEALGFFGVTSGDFADIYTKLEGPADPQGPIVQRDLKDEFAIWQANNQQQGNGARARQPLLAELWEIKFRRSQQFQRYVVDRLAQAPQGPVAGVGTAIGGRTPRISPLRQFGILARRYLDLLFQDRRNFLILLLQAPIIALLLLVVARADALAGENPLASEAKKVLFMLSTVAVWFGIINAAREITKETAIYYRERLANLGIIPYVGSKVAILMLLVIVQSLVLLGMLSLKVAFPESGVLLPAFLEMLITTVLTSFAGLALGLVISAASATPDRAISIVPLALIPQILFAGLIFNLEDWDWSNLGFSHLTNVLSWFTISRWSMDAYGASVNLNEMRFNAQLLPIPDDRYNSDIPTLLSRWLVLLVYGLICVVITGWMLKQRDQRR